MIEFANPFDKDYYQTGNYRNYLARGPRYDYMAQELVELLTRIGILERPCKQWILDFGCGPGFLTHGLQKQGHPCMGYDISDWAIQYGSQELNILDLTTNFLNCERSFQLAVALDVFEHMPIEEIERVVSGTETRHWLVRIPLGDPHTGFNLSVSQDDKTHITPMRRAQWISLFKKNGYSFLVPLHLGTIYDTEDVMCALFRYG